MQIPVDARSSIGGSSALEGRFAARGNLKIDGRFEGEALLVDQLSVGPRARVRTSIAAASVVIEGVVIGNISASRRVLLLSTARVLGDIKTPELIIQDGVVLEGRCTISHTRIDNTRQYIEELYGRSRP